MFTRIPGNLLEHFGKCYFLTFQGMFQKFPGNVRGDSGACSRKFRRMFKQILANAQEDSGECSRVFPRMFKKIPLNAQEDFWESKFRFIL